MSSWIADRRSHVGPAVSLPNPSSWQPPKTYKSYVYFPSLLVPNHYIPAFEDRALKYLLIYEPHIHSLHLTLSIISLYP